MISPIIYHPGSSEYFKGIQIEHVSLSGQKPSLREIAEADNKYILKQVMALTFYSNEIFIISTEKTTMQKEIHENILPSYHKKNMRALQAAFDKEVIKYSQYLPIEESVAKSIFKETASIVSELPFKDGIVELTKDNGFKFTLIFPENKLLMISKSLRQEDSPMDNSEIIFSLFINRELIASDAANIEKFKEGFRELLSMPPLEIQ